MQSSSDPSAESDGAASSFAASKRKAVMTGRSTSFAHRDELRRPRFDSSARSPRHRADRLPRSRPFRKRSPACNRRADRACARPCRNSPGERRRASVLRRRHDVDRRPRSQSSFRSAASLGTKTDRRKAIDDSAVRDVAAPRRASAAAISTSARATGISCMLSSVSETRIVSPIPSCRSEPIPIALLIRASSPSPASVTPR